jgi:hypothetical protein
MHAKTRQALLGCLMFACGALVASLVSAHPRQAVEHAPTVKQCQADRAYWMSKLEQAGGKGTADVTYNILMGWQSEMDKCMVVDPSNYFKYYNTSSETNSDQKNRLVNFLMRHDLYTQFAKEDLAGAR